MTRTMFYEYKRRFQLYGIERLKNLPPIPKTHLQTTPPEIQEKIIALSLEHPSWRCYRLSEVLKSEGISVSGPMMQNILAKNGLATIYDRLLKLEEK